jgi:predicted aminopeptidase
MSNRARPIDEVLADERTPPRLKALLGEIPAVKRYGEENGLKATSNYTEYAKLDRPAAVWVVSACEPLRFKSREWSFPLVGSFTSLGWFDLDAAKAFAAAMRESADGDLDVDVRPARAYSTLGWFRDAVLSTMIPDGEEALGDLVNVVLHESVHATLYLDDQAYFNESLASFVADRLAPAYLEKTRGRAAAEFAAYLKSEAESSRRHGLIRRAYEELAAVYASARRDAEKKSEKARVLSTLKTELGLKREPNNATLVQSRTYGVGMPEFKALLEACEGSWPRFWKAMRALEKSRAGFTSPHQEDLAPVLVPPAKAGCPS